MELLASTRAVGATALFVVVRSLLEGPFLASRFQNRSKRCLTVIGPRRLLRLIFLLVLVLSRCLSSANTSAGGQYRGRGRFCSRS